MANASAAWQTPIDQSNGTTIDATEWNEQVAQNLAYLNARPSASYELDEASDYTTASTSFADIDASNLSLTITTNGGDVRVYFDGVFSIDTANEYIYLEVDVDAATSVIGGDDGITHRRIELVTDRVPLSFLRRVTGLSAAAHTFKLQWKVSGGGGTGTLYAGAGTADNDSHGYFLIEEC